ncbi:GNAT family N-acetyltransferase [Kitasatospora sp. NBC_01250]|uniref:GNAT family N-acetyltransferase n=1 Tax=Kitasatospora sp. NBC_01250 TaxID=2903571 RepID=UPI002E320E01|nr:GNAT family N-acetyltransferase [Kitasatospora sp. NBC_01250]
MSPVLTFREAGLADELAEPLIRELTEEYVARYGEGAHEEMARYPAAEFAPPHGLLLLLLADGEPVAGGAFRRYDESSAELKRMWTHSAHRRRGLARRVLGELEQRARLAGYRRIFLTTGPRQPEAKGLYLAAGYTPLFVEGEPATPGPLPFEKFLNREARTP